MEVFCMWRIVVVTYLQQPAAAGPCQHHPGSRISTPTFPGTRHLHGSQCHASPGDNGKPSIATLVSSVDAAYSAQDRDGSGRILRSTIQRSVPVRVVGHQAGLHGPGAGLQARPHLHRRP